MVSLSKTKIIANEAILKFFSINAEILVFLIHEKEVVSSVRSKIIHFSSEDFFITTSSQNDFFLNVHEGSNLYFKILPPDSYFIEFSSIVIGFVERDGSLFLHVKFPEFVFKYQRRETFRVNVAIGAVIKINRLMTLEIEEISVKIIDLSLGGALIATNTFLQEGKKGEIFFKINNDIMHLIFIVKRAKKLQSIKSKYLFHLGITFSEMKEVFNQKLSQFIIKNQLESLKRLNH